MWKSPVVLEVAVGLDANEEWTLFDKIEKIKSNAVLS